MKNKIKILIALLLMTAGVSAQIDRSVQPKPGPAPKISLENPKEFKLKNGMTVLVVENHKLPRVTYSLMVDRVPRIEGEKAGLADLLGSMMGNGTTSIPKDKFNDEVDFLGAHIYFGAGSARAASLSKYDDKILKMLADATINPLLTDEELQKEKAKMIDGIKSSEKNVSAIAGRVGRALSYGEHHPFGEITSEKTVNNVTLADIKDAYQYYFSPYKSYLVVVGDVNYKDVKKKVQKYFGKWPKSTIDEPVVPDAKPNVSTTEIDFVDMPQAVQSNISLTNLAKLRKKDPDYHAVLIANKILGGGFNSYLNMNLREAHGYTYGARSSIRPNKYITRFTAGAKVRNAVTDSAVVQTIKEIKRIREEAVAPEMLSSVKAKYTGDFVLALEDPQTIAEYALNIKINDLPEDFYVTFLEKINKVTAADVQRVANKYFLPDQARIVIVGKGSDVIENLEKTGLPIKYFDTYAHPVEKPEFHTAVPAGITADVVFEKYLEAIGGKANIDKVKSIAMKAEAEVQPGVTMTLHLKKTNEGKYWQEIAAMGMVMSKQVLNGDKGYLEAQGQKKEMTEEQIVEVREQSRMFPEMSYLNKDMKVESIEDVNGEKAYKIKISDKQTNFYSVDSGLLIKQETAVGNMTSSVYFTDYKAVNGVKFPFKMTQVVGPQKFDFIVKEVKVNDGVTEADFKLE